MQVYGDNVIQCKCMEVTLIIQYKFVEVSLIQLHGGNLIQYKFMEVSLFNAKLCTR